MPAETEVAHGHAKVNENGRILIPAAVREQMGLKAGDSVVWTLDDGGVLRLQSYMAVIRQIQEDFKPFRKPGVSMVDEFIAERREEARREMEEYLA